MSNRLASIVHRQHGTRVRDAIFAACLGLGLFLHVGAVAAAADAAAPAAVAAPAR
jgi:hypothetical protein